MAYMIITLGITTLSLIGLLYTLMIWNEERMMKEVYRRRYVSIRNQKEHDTERVKQLNETIQLLRDRESRLSKNRIFKVERKQW